MRALKTTLLFLIIIVSCAKKGRPTGGEKDKIPPLLVTVSPSNTTNFKAKSIRINFDEYIVLKDLSKQLIISPPLKNPPTIIPQGTASKYIKIKFAEKLSENTTYIFNFGNSIQDNNESNKLEAFKYVFSTGNKIDSLQLEGSVKDVVEGKLKKNCFLLLYKADKFKDSIIFKEKPNYVTSTRDSLNFKFSNIKEGKYRVFALKQEINDYLYNPKKDKIAFLDEVVSLPKDSILLSSLRLFKEVQPFKYKRGAEVSKAKINFKFSGDRKDFKVRLLTKVPSKFQSYSEFEKDKDTLNYWFTPIEKDSLNFVVSNKKYSDTISVSLGKKNIDSLKVKPSISGTFKALDTLFFNMNNPIIKIEKDKISMEKDSVKIPFTIIEKKKTKLAVLFKNTPSSNYKLNVLPGAFTDIYQTKNDTISLSFRTKKIEDYGSINLTIENKLKSSLIFELVSNGKVVRTKTTRETSVLFKYLLPKKYKIRVIVDENNNNVWDTGNYLKKIQPERIIYFDKEITLRANWEIEENFTIE